MSTQHQDTKATGTIKDHSKASASFTNSPIDFSLLQKEGGPVSYSKQVGYGNAFLTANILVFGDTYNMVKVTFTNSSGTFPNPIYLNPNNLIQTNITVESGLMTLSIKEIQLYTPTPDDNGSVYLNATWTDLNGKGNYSYVDPIANWSNPPADSDKK